MHRPAPQPSLAVFSVVCSLTVAPAVHAQHADQKALEAAVRALAPPSGTPIFVSPRMVAPEVQGNVSINRENQAILEERFGARIVEAGDVVACEDVSRPESCRVEDDGVLFQFFMPEPVRNGVLHLSVMLLENGVSEDGQIGRQWWNIALVQRPELGWTVVDKTLASTADGPW